MARGVAGNGTLWLNLRLSQLVPIAYLRDIIHICGANAPWNWAELSCSAAAKILRKKG
jgi:hypothetical protein